MLAQDYGGFTYCAGWDFLFKYLKKIELTHCLNL